MESDAAAAATAAATKSIQSYLTLCDPIDGSPPGSAIPGILQARTLECEGPRHLHRIPRLSEAPWEVP